MTSTRGVNSPKKEKKSNNAIAVNAPANDGSLASERLKHKLPNLRDGKIVGNQKEDKDVDKGSPPPPVKPDYDYVNPQHYVQEDGKQTWERMVDIWGKRATALWCEMTAFKYKERIGKKPNENIEREKSKIEWYENKSKELKGE